MRQVLCLLDVQCFIQQRYYRNTSQKLQNTMHIRIDFGYVYFVTCQIFAIFYSIWKCYTCQIKIKLTIMAEQKVRIINMLKPILVHIQKKCIFLPFELTTMSYRSHFKKKKQTNKKTMQIYHSTLYRLGPKQQILEVNL